MISFSCSDSSKKKIIPRNKMEKILYDYHLTQGIISSLPIEERKVKTDKYLEAVLEENGVTRADFDSSMVWYNRNTEELKKIYDNLQDKYKDLNEEMRLKTGSNEMTNVFSEGSDTTNIWNGAKLIILRNRDILNKSTFSFNADTSYYKNDLFILSVNCSFLKEFPDERNLTLYAGLSVEYSNGKIVSTVNNAKDNGTLQVKIDVMNNLDITDISGFFFFKGKDEFRNYVAINNISLYRMHRDVAPGNEKIDTTKVDSLVVDSSSIVAPEEKGEYVSPQERREQNKKEQLKIKSRPDRLTPNKFGPRRKTQQQQNKK